MFYELFFLKILIISKHIKYTKNTLNEDMDMQFDVIIGNPPFQPFGSSGTGNKIWPKFVEVGINSLTERGWMAFITPNHWRLMKSERGVHKEAQRLIWENVIVDFSPANKFFDVGGIVKMDYWIITKDKNIEGLEIPDILRERMILSENIDEKIIDFLEETDRGYNYIMNLGDNRNYSFDSINKSKEGDKEHPYPHINTFPQFNDGFFDWYSVKTKGFDDKKVMISLVKSPNMIAFFDDKGKYGCGHKTHAYPVDNNNDGLKLENFLNNSKIIKKFEEIGRAGFAIPLKLFRQIPKSYVERFNNGEDL